MSSSLLQAVSHPPCPSIHLLCGFFSFSRTIIALSVVLERVGLWCWRPLQRGWSQKSEVLVKKVPSQCCYEAILGHSQSPARITLSGGLHLNGHTEFMLAWKPRVRQRGEWALWVLNGTGTLPFHAYFFFHEIPNDQLCEEIDGCYLTDLSDISFTTTHTLARLDSRGSLWKNQLSARHLARLVLGALDRLGWRNFFIPEPDWVAWLSCMTVFVVAPLAIL